MIGLANRRARDSFLPVLKFGGGTTGITYSVQSGLYDLDGEWLQGTIAIILTSKGSSTGAAVITGLPITVPNSNANTAPAALRISNITYGGMIQAFATINTSQIGLEQVAAATGVLTNITDANFANTSGLWLAFRYRIA